MSKAKPDIQLVEPQERIVTPSDRKYFRLNRVFIWNRPYIIDVAKRKEEKYRGTVDWIRHLANIGWKLPSLEEYHHVFSLIYDLRQKPGFRSLARAMRKTFQENEFSDTTPYMTSTTLDFCSCGQGLMSQGFGQPYMWHRMNFPEFTSGKIGKHDSHKKALKLLMGDEDIDRITAVWKWIAGRDVSLCISEKKINPNDSYYIILASNFFAGHVTAGAGILARKIDATACARAFRRMPRI